MHLNMFREVGARWLKKGAAEPLVERASFPCSYYFYRHCKFGLSCKYAHSLRIKEGLPEDRRPCFQHIIKNCKNTTCQKYHEFTEEELLELLE
jgi:hypothetical protein